MGRGAALSVTLTQSAFGANKDGLSIKPPFSVKSAELMGVLNASKTPVIILIIVGCAKIVLKVDLNNPGKLHFLNVFAPREMFILKIIIVVSIVKFLSVTNVILIKRNVINVPLDTH